MSSTALLLGALAVSGSNGVVNRDYVPIPTEGIVASLANGTLEAYRRFTHTFAETESGAGGHPVLRPSGRSRRDARLGRRRLRGRGSPWPG
jgi:hypothetical protein